MKQDKKNFTWFQQVVDPDINIAYSPDQSAQFALGYRSVSDKEKDFLVKFKIISPGDSKKVLEITHGYLFSVREDFVICQNLQKLAGFFTFLIAESLNKVNESLPEEKIKIPSRKDLVKTIHEMLLSHMN